VGLLSLWTWIKGVVTATGAEDPVPIELERTGRDEYAFRLGLRAGFGGQETARIPVTRRPNPNPHPILKEVHSCEVAGQHLEAANVHALRAKVARALDSIAPARTLPLCWFRSPSGFELAVYEHGGEIICPLLGGPKLKARDLAGIRTEVCRHLVSAGYAEEPEQVTVGVLQPRDLRRVDPAAIFRSHADSAVWLPAIEGVSDEGPVLGVLDHALALLAQERRRGAGPAPREAMPIGPDVIALLRVLRGEWARRRELEPEALHATDVDAAAWAAAEARTRDAGTRLVAHLEDDEATTLELPVRRTGAGDVATAIQERGITLLLAADEGALAAAVRRHLAAGGFLRAHAQVEIRAVAAPRAERLEADTIRTHEPEEARA
jgi:hypothetical protein